MISRCCGAHLLRHGDHLGSASACDILDLWRPPRWCGSISRRNCRSADRPRVTRGGHCPAGGHAGHGGPRAAVYGDASSGHRGSVVLAGCSTAAASPSWSGLALLSLAISPATLTVVRWPANDDHGEVTAWLWWSPMSRRSRVPPAHRGLGRGGTDAPPVSGRHHQPAAITAIIERSTARSGPGAGRLARVGQVPPCRQPAPLCLLFMYPSVSFGSTLPSNMLR